MVKEKRHFSPLVKGDTFIAILKKSQRSKTLAGKEAAGRQHGPLKVTAVGYNGVWAGYFFYDRREWFLRKVNTNMS